VVRLGETVEEIYRQNDNLLQWIILLKS